MVCCAGPHAMASNVPSALAGLRILVVEDEYMVAELLCMILENFGCSVVGPYATVTEAVVAVSVNELDGALVDVNLDGEDSGPVATALNAASVPFVVATGYGALPILDKLLGQAPRIHKPFRGSELEETLTAAFIYKAGDKLPLL